MRGREIVGLAFFSALLFLPLGLFAADEGCEPFRGALIIGQDADHTYLGKIANNSDGDSIFNDFSPYGDPLSPKSIWNEFSTFGNSFNGLSPFNESSATPPEIVKDGSMIGYLSMNKNVKNSISPNALKELCKEAL